MRYFSLLVLAFIAIPGTAMTQEFKCPAPAIAVSNHTDLCEAQAYRLSGIGLLSESNWAGAITAFSKSLNLNKNQADVYLLRGFARLKQAMPDTVCALNDFDQAILLAPTQISALYMSADLRNDNWSDAKIKELTDNHNADKTDQGAKKTALAQKNKTLKKAQDEVAAKQKAADDAKESVNQAQADLNESQMNLDAANANYRRIIQDPNDKDQKNLNRATAIRTEEKRKVNDAIDALKASKAAAENANKQLADAKDKVTQPQKDFDDATAESANADAKVKQSREKITDAMKDLDLAIEYFKKVIMLDPARKGQVQPKITVMNDKIDKLKKAL